MINAFLSKLSGALFRAHRYLDSKIKMGRQFQPYTIQYPAVRGTTKIVHVIGNFIVGGSTQLVVDIIERTSAHYCHKVVVPELEGIVAYQPVDIREFSVANLRPFAEWLRKEDPALVHIHYFVRPSDRYTSIALWYDAIYDICEELGYRVVQNVNVPTYPHVSSAVIHNVFVSHFVQRKFNNLQTESSVIYPGSNFNHFRNEDVESLPAKSIGMVYRLDEDKLRADAIEVFIEIAKRDPEISSYIVGGGSMFETFRRRVIEEGVQDRIHLTGFISYEDLPEIYKKFSIFVAPVHDESFGQVTPFAMSMGQCVAGYETGAIPEIIGSTETLVATGDVDKLVAIVLELVNDHERRKRYALANMERSRNLFSVEHMIEQYSDLYSRLIKGGVHEAKN